MLGELVILQLGYVNPAVPDRLDQLLPAGKVTGTGLAGVELGALGDSRRLGLVVDGVPGLGAELRRLAGFGVAVVDARRVQLLGELGQLGIEGCAGQDGAARLLDAEVPPVGAAGDVAPDRRRGAVVAALDGVNGDPALGGQLAGLRVLDIVLADTLTG